MFNTAVLLLEGIEIQKERKDLYIIKCHKWEFNVFKVIFNAIRRCEI